RVAVVVLVAFLALLAAPLYWQVLAAPRLGNKPRHTPGRLKEDCTTGGAVRARRPRGRRDRWWCARRYPQGERYGMVTGFYSLVYGRTLAEQEFNSFLLRRAAEEVGQNVGGLVNGTPH